jgi:hypothetical protein
MTDQQYADVTEDDRAPVPSRTAADLGDTSEADLPRWRRGRLVSDGSRLYWYKELGIILSVYLVYETVRNISKGRPSVAFSHAVQVIGWQKDLGINHEKAIQDWALHSKLLVVVSNYYYGIAYIACTIAILLWLYKKRSEDYPLWRNTLLVGTVLGLIGFATYPLMPPRLLDVSGFAHQSYGFVDTLVRYPTFWSFDSPTMKSVSNQFAAMPSLHCGWALWGAAAVFPRVKSRWMKALAIAYPVATVFVVVATGNHYFLDAVGGAVIFIVGYAVARLITRAGRSGRTVSPAAADR